MPRILIILFLLISLCGFSQKNKKAGNYLRREKQEPESWFTLCGKKNGSRLKVVDLEKAESIKPGDKFDGYTILGIEVTLLKKGMTAETFSSDNLTLPEEFKSKISSLLKGDKVKIAVKMRNRSTQVINSTVPHTYYISQ
jgi:hypothetical protein